MFLARRSLTSLRKTILQCHSPRPTLFRLDFPFPLVSSQTKQKLPNLSLNSLSFPNNPIHKAWRNRPTSFSSTPTFQFFFFFRYQDLFQTLKTKWIHRQTKDFRKALPNISPSRRPVWAGQWLCRGAPEGGGSLLELFLVLSGRDYRELYGVECARIP